MLSIVTITQKQAPGNVRCLLVFPAVNLQALGALVRGSVKVKAVPPSARQAAERLPLCLLTMMS